jgi:hypothetical protein
MYLNIEKVQQNMVHKIKNDTPVLDIYFEWHL